MSDLEHRSGTIVDATRDLEQRCVAALTGSETITSSDIERLIAEVEGAIDVTEETAETERRRARDPVRSPDPVAARETMDAAAFAVERLGTLLRKLEVKLQKAERREAIEHWRPSYDAAKQKRDKLVNELREAYVPFAERLASVLLQVPAVDRECWHVNEIAPDGAGRYLQSVEEEARGRKGLLHDVFLPPWEPGAAPYWPRRD